jgi:hypothetical protein
LTPKRTVAKPRNVNRASVITFWQRLTAIPASAVVNTVACKTSSSICRQDARIRPRPFGWLIKS